MAPKHTAGGKLLLLGPVQLGVTYSVIYVCFPVLGSSYVPEHRLHASMRVSVWEAGKYCEGGGSSRMSAAAVRAQLGNLAAGTCPTSI